MSPTNQRLESSRFTETLYLVFQDFKAAVDSYLAETIHPRIVTFIREEEEKIKSHLESVATPYAVMVKEAMSDYQASMADTGVSPQPEQPWKQDGFDGSEGSQIERQAESAPGGNNHALFCQNKNRSGYAS